MRFLQPGPSRTYETSELGARRSFGHVFNDQHRVIVVARGRSDLNHSKRLVPPKRDRVASSPIRNGRFERRRLGRCSVLALELEGEGAHSVSFCIDRDRTAELSLSLSGRRFDLRLRRRRLTSLLARCCLILLLTAVIAGCGSTGGKKNAAPEYAATPRKVLESWVTAVREGDFEMMCRLLHPRSRCSGPDEAYIEPKFLRHVRGEMRGLNGDLHYGAIDIGAPESRIVIGVVSGESPIAYAVPVLRGLTQWSIKEEFSDPGGFARIVLERPDPGAALASGRTGIAFSALAWDAGSNYPNAALWIDSRHVNGRLDVHPAHGLQPVPRDESSYGMEPVRWIGAAKLLPGRHVMVAAVKGDGGIARTSAWLLTVR
jgi:hypothetical protein